MIFFCSSSPFGAVKMFWFSTLNVVSSSDFLILFYSKTNFRRYLKLSPNVYIRIIGIWYNFQNILIFFTIYRQLTFMIFFFLEISMKFGPKSYRDWIQCYSLIVHLLTKKYLSTDFFYRHFKLNLDEIRYFNKEFSCFVVIWNYYIIIKVVNVFYYILYT